MTYKELSKDLDPTFKGWTKRDFIDFVTNVDGRVRVGGPTGKGRLTAKKAAALLMAGVAA